MKIIVDKNKCIGCGICDDVSESALGLQFGKNGVAVQNPKVDLTDHAVVSNVKLAIETCPTQAIKIEE